MKKVVAYYRVSTNDQNLGIDAQKSIVKQYCDLNSVEIISEYEEHESGKNNHRVQLAIALEETVKTGSYLIVAKIDRLTRVAYFGLQLCEKYKIIFCDHPTMGTLEQSIYFGMAQQEREYISQRTKAALAALKSKGVKLGAPNAHFSDVQRSMALSRRKNNSRNNEANRKAYAILSIMSGNWTDKAKFLNKNGFKTSKGGIWRPQQVQRLVEMMSRL
jgi:DNA invertase Pin-like site-specific DNA recombinase